MELYAEYLKDVCDMKMVNTDTYFFTYKVNESNVYLQDVYIKKEFRNAGIIDDIFAQVYDIAEKEDLNIVKTSISKNILGDNKDRTKHILEKRGYVIYEEDDYMDYYYKELR